MKKLLKVALVAGCMLLTAGFAKAQAKIGYLSFNDLVVNTAEYKSIQTQIDAYQKTFIDSYNVMQTELSTKASDYEAKKSTMTDAVKAKTEGELQDLQKRTQDYQTYAGNQVQAKSNELLKPLIDKLKAAISQVAKEKGYTYVIDASNADMLLVKPDGDDLLAAVRTRAGVGAAPAATAAPVKK